LHIASDTDKILSAGQGGRQVRRNNMGRMSLEGMLEVADYDTALRWHLTNNHYPPVPLSMLEACKSAIEACNDDDSQREIELPGGVSWRGRESAPAWAIIEGHHLESFIASDDDY
jgi:hypothetical protein